MIRLSADAEPEIYRTTRTFGTILENVVLDERGILDLEDDAGGSASRGRKLGQIRADHLREARRPSTLGRDADRGRVRRPAADRAPHARAPGDVLVPLQADRLAGTEIGVKEPAADLLALLQRPFLLTGRLRALLGRKLDEHRATVWLVNTGWTTTGGPYGEGRRMPIKATRILGGAVGRARRRHLPHRRPLRLRGSNRRAGRRPMLLYPRSTWSDPADAYGLAARELAMFRDCFTRFDADENIVAAGPASSCAGTPAPRGRGGGRPVRGEPELAEDRVHASRPSSG